MAKKKSPSEAQAAHVAVLRLADQLHRRMREVLSPHGLSEPQFNVLRILRGAGSEGLACKEVGSRMVSQVPDTTRLLDRLEAMGFLERSRSTQDRRVVMARITSRGESVLAGCDPDVKSEQKAAFAALGGKERRKLLEILRNINLS